MDIPKRLRKNYSDSFRKFGIFISTYPKLAILLPIFSTALLSLGILNYKIVMNFDYLFAPSNCRSYQETEALLRLFPMNSSSAFDPMRIIRNNRHGSIIVVAKEGGTVLTESVFSEIVALDKIVNLIEVEHENRVYNYSSICARNGETCFRNHFFTNDDLRLIESGRMLIKYPVDTQEDKLVYGSNITLGINLGGVTTDSEDNVLKASAYRLNYPLDDSDYDKNIIGEKWENRFLETLAVRNSTKLDTSIYVSSSFDVETWSFVQEILSISWISYVIVTIFCVVSCMDSDWVTSKPVLAICGCTSASLATFSCFGAMMAVGVPCAPVNIVVPFVVLGIGMDDSFVLIAAWRKTDRKKEVSQRVGEAYSEAAISITVTSLTNFLSFCIGMVTPFPVNRIVCAYLAAAMVFDFIYQVTFFGGCMALDGIREERGLHPITLRPVISTEQSGTRSHLYRLLFTDKAHPNETPHFVMAWFRDYLGKWIGKTWGRCLISLTFAAYLFGAGWNMASLTEGLDSTKIFQDWSYANAYLTNHYRYFAEYPFTIQAVINVSLDYSDPQVQSQVLDILGRFSTSPYIADYKTGWLHYYLKFLEHPNSWLFCDIKDSSKAEDFTHCLQNVFLQFPESKVFSQDIIFGDDGVNISASRFVLIAKGVNRWDKERAALLNVRSIADSSPLPVIVQCMWWIKHEQFVVAKPLAINCVIYSLSATALVVTIFTCHPVAAVCCTTAMVSMIFGVAGYMPLWNVQLNSISTLILVMCVGFSVDYSAHVSYAYIAAKGSSRDRIKQSLFSVGMPITQSCVSSILGVLVLIAGRSFVLQTFIRIILLLFIFAFIHSILILPTFLALCDDGIHSVISLLKKRRKTPPNNCTEIPLSISDSPD